MFRSLAILFLPALCGATAYTASQDGNFGSSATWGGAGIPAFGDTINTNCHTVTVPGAYTANVGIAGSLSIEVPDCAGGIIVNGAGTLQYRGKWQFDGTSAGDAHTGQIFNCKTGCTLILDENGTSNPAEMFTQTYGVYPQITFGTLGDPYHTVAQCNAGATCTRVTSVNKGSANGILFYHNGNFSNMDLKMYGVTVDYCGSSSQACVDWSLWGGFGHTAQVDVRNSSFDHAGGLINSQRNLLDNSASFNMDGTTFTNGLRTACTNLNCGPQDVFLNVAPHPGTITGTRSITNSYLGVTNDLVSGFRFTGDVFTNWVVGLPGAGPLDASDKWTFQNNLMLQSDCTQSQGGTAIYGDVTNNYLVALADAGGNCTWMTSLDDSVDLTISGNVFDWQGAAPDNPRHCFGPSFTSSTPSLNITITNNLILWGADGLQACHLYEVKYNTTTFSGQIKVEHNTTSGHGTLSPSLGNGTIFFAEAGSILTVGQLTTYKSNLYYDSSVDTAVHGVLWYNTAAGNLTSQPCNVIDPRQIDYNSNFNAPLSRSQDWTDAIDHPCQPNTGVGTPYSIPLITYTPGVHDITGDQKPVDTARNIAQWNSTVRGGAATVAGALASILSDGPANFAADIQGLRWYMRHGWMPGNPVVWGAAHDATDIGAVQTSLFPAAGSMRTNLQ
jgi:hypothetical protein